MTDRDTFAAAALTGLLSHYGLAGPGRDHDVTSKGAAGGAYKYADAMLAERDKTSAQKDNDRGSVTPESYAKDDEKRVLYDTNRGTTQPRSGALDDAEREAVEQAIDAANGMALIQPWAMRTLRGLLERLA